MKYLFGVFAAFALMFVCSQEADAQVFRGHCGGGYTYSYPSYSYPTYYYSYPSYSYSCSSGGYYVRGCDGRLYYVYPSQSQSQPTYVAPKEAPSFQDVPAPKTVPLKENVPALPKKEAPSFNDLPVPKSVEQPSATPRPVVRPPVITAPAPGFQDLPPKR